MTELRPKGWTGPVWVHEALMPNVYEPGEPAYWFPHDVWFHDVSADYADRPGHRVRRATLTMEE